MRRVLSLLFLLLVLTVAPAGATQKDLALDALFARLQATTDAREAEAVQATIWERWLAIDDPAATHMMTVGTIALGQGRVEDALSALDALIEAAPDYAEAWHVRAVARYLRGDRDAALADLGHAVALEPRHFAAWAGKGAIHLERSEPREALAAFEAALAANPHFTDVREALARLQAVMKGEGV